MLAETNEDVMFMITVWIYVYMVRRIGPRSCMSSGEVGISTDPIDTDSDESSVRQRSTQRIRKTTWDNEKPNNCNFIWPVARTSRGLVERKDPAPQIPSVELFAAHFDRLHFNCSAFKRFGAVPSGNPLTITLPLRPRAMGAHQPVPLRGALED